MPQQLAHPQASCIQRYGFATAAVLLLAFLYGTLSPLRDTTPTTSLPFLPWGLQWLQVYCCAIGVFITVSWIIVNAYDFMVPSPRRLSLSDDYVNGNPPKVDKLTAFAYDTPLNLYERVKMFVFLISGVAFVRLLLGILFILIGMVCVAMAGQLDRHRHPWWFMVWHRATVAMSVMTFACFAMYHIKTYGQLADRSECKLLIANHSCVCEVIITFVMAHLPSFVSRRENTKVFLFSSVARASDSILVDRDAAMSRHQTLEAIVRRADDPKASQLMIFPEGTTANQRTLFMFKKGAFEAGTPVQMICFAFPYTHFNPAWTGRRVGGNDFSDILVRLCCQFVNYAEVRILPLYVPTADEQKNPVLYANHCQKMMATVLGENISDATYKDYGMAEQHYKELKIRKQHETHSSS